MNALVPPKGWIDSTLEKLAKIERTTVQPEEIQTGTTYVGLEHITSEGQFIEVQSVEAGELASNKFAFNDEHLLYGKLRPYLKKIARPNFSGVCSTDILPILPSPKVDRNFLYYYLRQPSYIDLATTRSIGANLPRLSPKALAEFPVFIPPLEEQRRIAAILDKADAVRRKRKEAIALTEELLRSAFLEMFGDPATNPMSWKTAVLAEVCTKVTDGTHHMPNTVENGIPILRALNIKNDKIDKSNLVYISEEDYEKISKRSFLEKGDVLLTCLGTIGNIALFEEDLKFSLVRNVALLKPNYERTTSEFLQVLLKSNYLQGQMKARAKQSSQAALYIGEIEKLKIFIPPMSLQKRFSKVSENLRELLQKQQQDQSQQNNLFNSLLQRAFRGEL